MSENLPVTGDLKDRIREAWKDLTPRYKKFCSEYTTGKERGNGSKSAEKSGYSKKNAYSQASRLLNNAKIRRYLDLKTEEMLQITNAKMLDNMNNIIEAANMDVRDLFDENGAIKDVKDWPASIAKNVNSLKFSALNGKLTNLSLGKQMEARKVLAQMYNQLTPDPIIIQNNEINLIVQEAAELAQSVFDEFEDAEDTKFEFVKEIKK